MATAQAGWGRLTWNTGAWNTTPDVGVVITGNQLQTEIDFGAGWSRDTWSAGAWNIGLGAILTGNGNVFSLSTLTELQTATGNVDHTGSAVVLATGQEANVELTSALTIVDGEGIFVGIATPPLTASIGNTDLSTNNFLAITGEELTVENNLSNVVITAGAPITIIGEELTTNTGVVVTGTANFIDITGNSITADLNDITISASATTSITGNQANTASGTVTVGEGHGVVITGSSVSISEGNVTVTGIAAINITGIQANVDLATLRFWDPIVTNTNVESWTNILANASSESWTNILR